LMSFLAFIATSRMMIDALIYARRGAIRQSG